MGSSDASFDASSRSKAARCKTVRSTTSLAAASCAALILEQPHPMPCAQRKPGPILRVFLRRVGNHEPWVPHLSRLLRRAGNHEPWVPHPSRLLAKGGKPRTHTSEFSPTPKTKKWAAKFDLCRRPSLGFLEVAAMLRLPKVCLLQELGYFLLHTISLRQRSNARLAQNLILRHIRSR
jgi:hypothetical protein